MEYYEDDSQNSVRKEYNTHDACVNDVPGKSGMVCPQVNTFSMKDDFINEAPTESFLADLNETNSKSGVNFNYDLPHRRSIGVDNPFQQQMNQSKFEQETTDDDCILNTNSTNSVLSLFPFVCGICDKNFDNLPKYYEHLTLHNRVVELLHCHSSTESNDILYTCGVCGIMYPTLCLLYEHILNVEKLEDFVYKSSSKTVYAFKDDADKVNKLDQHIKPEDVDNHEREREDITAVLSETSVESMGTESGFLQKTKNIETRKSVKQETAERQNSKKQTKGRLNSKKKLPKQVASINDNPNSRYRNDAKGKARKPVNLKTRDSEKNEDKRLTRLQCSNIEGETSTCDIQTNIGIKDEKTEETNDFMIGSENNYEDNEIFHAEYYEETDTEDNDAFKSVEHSEDVNDFDVGDQPSPPSTRRKLTNKKDEYFPCEICGGFYKHQNLQKHISIHDDRTFVCDQCPVAFKSQVRLNAHKRQVHVEEKKFTCDVCGKSFKAWPYLKQHRLCHFKSRDLECPHCPMKFQFKKILRTHLVTHSDDKPYSCEICDRTFKRIDRLNIHRKTTHSDERNFICPKCNKAFKTKTDMNRHHKTHLPPRHICHVCGKGFVQKCNMRIHLKVHGIFDGVNSKPCDKWVV